MHWGCMCVAFVDTCVSVRAWRHDDVLPAHATLRSGSSSWMTQPPLWATRMCRRRLRSGPCGSTTTGAPWFMPLARSWQPSTSQRWLADPAHLSVGEQGRSDRVSQKPQELQTAGSADLQTEQPGRRTLCGSVPRHQRCAARARVRSRAGCGSVYSAASRRHGGGLCGAVRRAPHTHGSCVEHRWQGRSAVRVLLLCGHFVLLPWYVGARHSTRSKLN